MKNNIDYKNVHILVIGVVHSIQAKGHIKWHIQKMEKKGFSEDLQKMMDAYLKNVRNELIRLCEQKGPDVVFEEGGLYDRVPGDRWKAWIRSGKTILEEKYGDKHIFVDAKMPRFLPALRKPRDRKREVSFINGIESYLQEKEGVHNIVFVVGADHLKRVKKMFEEKGFQIEVKDITEELKTEELKQKVKEEVCRLREERIKTKKKPFWVFWK